MEYHSFDSRPDTVPYWAPGYELRELLGDQQPLTIDDERIPTVQVDSPDYDTDASGIWVAVVHTGGDVSPRYGFLFRPAARDAVSDKLILRLVFPDGTAQDQLAEPADLGLCPYPGTKVSVIKSPNRTYIAPPETAPQLR